MTHVFSSQDLPNRFDHASAQDRIYRMWESGGYFHAEPDGREPFSIVIPPPNVTGALHLGHALNNTLQDILIRLRRMQGFNTLWMPGTDHAGIATQAVVERRLKEEENLTRHELGREKLVERIWRWKEQYEPRILAQLKRMGCSCDWERTRFTLDEGCAAAVRRTFFDLFQQRLIFRGKRLVNWDTFLQTAVSDDEVFHETIRGHFWHIRYPVIDPLPGEPEFVTIATTRPETLLGDTAVAVHPDPAKALDAVEAELAERLAKAAAKDKPALETQLENVRARRKTRLAPLNQLREMALAGRKLRLPLLGRKIPLVADEWAKPEMGSGCVKITPAHDPNDYEVGKRQSLPMINILNPDGTLNENAGPYAGLSIKKAREKVVADLEAAGLLAEVEDREIEIAHSDRSKTPIEPYLADQWFVKMSDREDGSPGLAQTAMDAVTSGRVNIYPERYAKSYLDWLAEKRDWPVSRQLWWGHQIPVWSMPLPPGEQGETVQGALRNLQRESPAKMAVGMEQDGNSPVLHVCLLTDDASATARLESIGFVRSEEVLDTWFSSALWPHSTLGWPEKTRELAYYYPTSVLITSRDIITLWVARMVLTGLNNVGNVPFREVFIHPKILDGYGETMSKSKGNGVDPLDVIDKFGPDALRYGLAHLTTETQDVRMPVQFECPHCAALVEQTKKNRELPRIACQKCGKEFSTQWAQKEADLALPRGAVVSERFELARNFCNKLWNASRFALLNLSGYSPGDVTAEELALEDLWILSRLATVAEEVGAALNSYRYADAARELYGFAWDEFCSFYVEMQKGRFQDEAQRPAAQRVLAHVLDTLLRLLHPIIPFITEEIWQLLGQVAPRRGFLVGASAGEQPALRAAVEPAAASIMIAPWPQPDRAWQNFEIESRFARFQTVLAGLREIRRGQNIAGKDSISFGVRCDAETAAVLAPLAPYFKLMAGAAPFGFGPAVEPPPIQATIGGAGLEVFVDLSGFIDVPAEIARNEKQAEKLAGLIKAKEAKLASPGFADRAPAEIVAKERASLEELEGQLKSTRAAIRALRGNT